MRSMANAQSATPRRRLARLLRSASLDDVKDNPFAIGNGERWSRLHGDRRAPEPTKNSDHQPLYRQSGICSQSARAFQNRREQAPNYHPCSDLLATAIDIVSSENIEDWSHVPTWQ